MEQVDDYQSLHRCVFDLCNIGSQLLCERLIAPISMTFNDLEPTCTRICIYKIATRDFSTLDCGYM